jgi:hypothetical protein
VAVVALALALGCEEGGGHRGGQFKSVVPSYGSLSKRYSEIISGLVSLASAHQHILKINKYLQAQLYLTWALHGPMFSLLLPAPDATNWGPTSSLTDAV